MLTIQNVMPHFATAISLRPTTRSREIRLPNALLETLPDTRSCESSGDHFHDMRNARILNALTIGRVTVNTNARTPNPRNLAAVLRFADAHRLNIDLYDWLTTMRTAA